MIETQNNSKNEKHIVWLDMEVRVRPNTLHDRRENKNIVKKYFR